MARPETDDDLAAALMDAEDPEPTDLLRFDRQGNLLSGTYTEDRPELHQMVADEMAATNGGSAAEIGAAIHRVNAAAKQARAAGQDNLLEGLILQYRMAQIREGAQPDEE
jgi:hypothetical protein